MDSAINVTKTLTSDGAGFIQTVFKFDYDTKAELLNMLQYIILSIIPAVIILKSIRFLIPDEDDSKGTFEILAEIVAQIVLIIGSLYFANKTIKYFPTYSGINYVIGGDQLFLLLPFMLLLLTIQTKLGAKVNILFDRMMDLWNGTNSDAVTVNKQVRFSQPLTGPPEPLNTQQLLPSNASNTQLPPNFDQMYQNQPTPMPGAATPGQGMQDSEPLAANSGSGNFSSW
jgi:hypothetical protein